MNDQLNFGSDYISELAIIRKYHQRIGAIGGRVVNARKSAAARQNVRKAIVARMAKRANKAN